jgi:hypothetical protein
MVIYFENRYQEKVGRDVLWVKRDKQTHACLVDHMLMISSSHDAVTLNLLLLEATVFDTSSTAYITFTSQARARRSTTVCFIAFLLPRGTG